MCNEIGKYVISENTPGNAGVGVFLNFEWVCTESEINHVAQRIADSKPGKKVSVYRKTYSFISA